MSANEIYPRVASALLAAVLLGVGGLSGVAMNQALPAPDDVQVVEIAPRYHLISDRTANLVLLMGDDASLVAGVQRPALIAAAKATIARLRAAPARFVITMEEAVGEESPSTLALGDGGWARDGAITLIQERFRGRMAKFGKSNSVSNAMPFIGFSHVVQVFLAGEEVHMIHERRGYSDADLAIHFEKEGVLYLGNSFTTDGYPAIDPQRGGSISGLIDTAESFLKGFRSHRALVEPIVPGRGRAGTMDDLQVYRDLLVTVRDRVREGIAAGRAKEEIVASKPTRELDERWGRGPITPDRFVAMVYDSLSGEKPATTAPARHNHQ